VRRQHGDSSRQPGRSLEDEDTGAFAGRFNAQISELEGAITKISQKMLNETTPVLYQIHEGG
jgi:hypothetical protein